MHPRTPAGCTHASTVDCWGKRHNQADTPPHCCCMRPLNTHMTQSHSYTMPRHPTAPAPQRGTISGKGTPCLLVEQPSTPAKCVRASLCHPCPCQHSACTLACCPCTSPHASSHTQTHTHNRMCSRKHQQLAPMPAACLQVTPCGDMPVPVVPPSNNLLLVNPPSNSLKLQTSTNQASSSRGWTPHKGWGPLLWPERHPCCMTTPSSIHACPVTVRRPSNRPSPTQLADPHTLMPGCGIQQPRTKPTDVASCSIPHIWPTPDGQWLLCQYLNAGDHAMQLTDHAMQCSSSTTTATVCHARGALGSQ